MAANSFHVRLERETDTANKSYRLFNLKSIYIKSFFNFLKYIMSLQSNLRSGLDSCCFCTNCIILFLSAGNQNSSHCCSFWKVRNNLIVSSFSCHLVLFLYHFLCLFFIFFCRYLLLFGLLGDGDEEDTIHNSAVYYFKCLAHRRLFRLQMIAIRSQSLLIPTYSNLLCR